VIVTVVVVDYLIVGDCCHVVVTLRYCDTCTLLLGVDCCCVGVVIVVVVVVVGD